MKNLSLLLTMITAVFYISCSENDDKILNKSVTYKFEADVEGWTGDFADYPNDDGVEEFYEMEFSHSYLPEPLNTSEGSIMMSGNNHSDDLFMFLKKNITGLTPNHYYDINLEVEFATNVPDSMLGVGGSPGEGVVIKAGATGIEPQKVLDEYSNWFRMNIDKGNQYLEGEDTENIGEFSNDTNEPVYTLKTLQTSAAISVKSDNNGQLWLIVGTDSGFEATTTIYYNRISAIIE